MLRLLHYSRKVVVPSTPPSDGILRFGPFNLDTQKRWKKPVDSAQTRLENRTRDLRLDKLMNQFKKLKLVMRLQELISEQRDQYMSVQLLSKWRPVVGVNIGMGDFLHKYPHIFEMFEHPVRKNVCCRITKQMTDLLEEETRIIKESEMEAVERLKRLIMMSTDGKLHSHALWLIRRELGLPDDFRTSILPKYPNVFRLGHLDTVALVVEDRDSAQVEIEKWREREYEEKWLSEFETKYAFPIQFPTGFRIESGFREKLKNWQRLPYIKPYEKKEVIRVRTCGGFERFEKRAVGVLHEFLSLMVEKMVEVERLSHFQREFSIEVNVRELLLKHPGIFYISTKGSTQTVFLREAYSKGCLIKPNRIYEVRRKMLDLVLLGCRNTNQIQSLAELEDERGDATCDNLADGPGDGDSLNPALQSYDFRPTIENVINVGVPSGEEVGK